jgi:hypothetical protein
MAQIGFAILAFLLLGAGLGRPAAKVTQSKS